VVPYSSILAWCLLHISIVNGRTLGLKIWYYLFKGAVKDFIQESKWLLLASSPTTLLSLPRRVSARSTCTLNNLARDPSVDVMSSMSARCLLHISIVSGGTPGINKRTAHKSCCRVPLRFCLCHRKLPDVGIDFFLC
jgi:hypothetical protein